MRDTFKRQITVVFEVESNYESTLSDDFIEDDMIMMLDGSINYYDVISIKDYEGESKNE